MANRKCIQPILLIALIAALTLPLSGCFLHKKPGKSKNKATAGKRYHMEQDEAPHAAEVIPDISKIPDAKPKPEPKSKYGNPKTYTVFKKSYTVMPSSKGYKARGTASWYGKKFHGYRTSNGDTYDMYGMSAAHKTLPLPTYARVTNLDNGKSVVVKVNDRGPFHEERLLDLSYAAASKLGILGKGTGNVEIHAIDSEIRIPQQYLQVGAFKDEKNAKELALKLKKITADHPISVRRPSSKNKLYYVHIGPINDETILTKLTNKLKLNKFPSPVAVQIE